MLAVRGIFDDGIVKLNQKVNFLKPTKVIVTFIDDIREERNPIDLNKFSFFESQKVLKNLKSSLSDAIIEERQIEL